MRRGVFCKMNSLMSLSDSLLLESYHKALKLKLEADFTEALKKEMKRRKIMITYIST